MSVTSEKAIVALPLKPEKQVIASLDPTKTGTASIFKGAAFALHQAAARAATRLMR